MNTEIALTSDIINITLIKLVIFPHGTHKNSNTVYLPIKHFEGLETPPEFDFRTKSRPRLKAIIHFIIIIQLVSANKVLSFNLVFLHNLRMK